MISNNIGDLLVQVHPEFGKCKFIVHGTNCQGKYKSGFAGQMRRTYPNAYDAYIRAHNNGKLLLGHVTTCGDNSFMIVNANTQEYYGRDPNTQYVSYDAIESCFTIIKEMTDGLLYSTFVHSDGTKEFIDDVQIHFPLIGCGLANGKWDVVSSIIEKVIPDDRSLILWTLPKTSPNLDPDFFSYPE